jgi:hypothetical protein
MKRTLLVFAAAALLGGPVLARAQGTTDVATSGVMLKGGLSYGNISHGGVFPGDHKERTGFAAGVGVWAGSGLGIGVEGLYAQRGITSRKLDYIDVPAYLRLELTNPAVSPFFYAGPQVSFELKCDADTGDCPSGRSKTTYAGVIGAGLRLGNFSGLSLEARYIYGLSDLHLDTITSSESYKTRSFLVLLGVGF